MLPGIFQVEVDARLRAQTGRRGRMRLEFGEFQSRRLVGDYRLSARR